MTRGFSSSLFRLLRVMACSSRRIFLRPDEVEFPMAASGNGRRYSGVRAQDCASTDALRPMNNRAVIEQQHELIFTRQTLATFARRPKTGRSSPASARGTDEARKEDILAASGCLFWKQSAEQESWLPERITSAATAAASATTTATAPGA